MASYYAVVMMLGVEWWQVWLFPVTRTVSPSLFSENVLLCMRTLQPPHPPVQQLHPPPLRFATICGYVQHLVPLLVRSLVHSKPLHGALAPAKLPASRHLKPCAGDASTKRGGGEVGDHGICNPAAMAVSLRHSSFE
jgi:hypothetical protein